MHRTTPGTAAGAARIADDLSRAVARAARPANRKETLLVEDLAPAVTSRTRCRTAARFGARAVTPFAWLGTRHLDLRVQSKGSFFETDLQIVADVLAALCPAPPPSATLSENVAE